MAQPQVFPAREIAVDDGARTFTEPEHRAIVADTVARETASRDEEITGLKAQVETLTTEKASAEERADVAQVAKETAERELAEYKAEVEQAKVIEARKDERVKAMRELLPDKPDEYFTERAQAWAEKADEAWEAYSKEIAEVVGGATPAPAGKETAMKGEAVHTDKAATGASGGFFSHFAGKTPKGA